MSSYSLFTPEKPLVQKSQKLETTEITAQKASNILLSSTEIS